MVAWIRRKVCVGASACLKCLDSVVVYNPAHNDYCKIVVDSKANKKAGRCTINCWVCTNHNHKVANKLLSNKIRNTMKGRGLSMGFAARLLKKVRKSSPPPANSMNGQGSEELYDDGDEPMRPADTEEIPEKRDCKSVPYFGGKELKSEGTLEMDIKVEY